MKFFLSALTLLMVTLASADKASLRANIKARLQMGGAYNCQYKCANLFNIQSLWDAENGNTGLNQMSRESVSVLNEYLGCAAGCDLCGGGNNGQCASQCKNKNWYNTVWWYNPHSGTSKVLEVDQDLLQQQANCVAKCGTPETGGRAILSEDFTDCTTSCYNDETFGIKTINDATIAICRRYATCDSINEKGVCLNADGSVKDKPMDARYTAAMCGAGVLKNIIEPDKACQFGCIQNLCQMGAGCLGNGAWSAETDNKQCQVITPQANGEKYTIVPDIFIRPGQDNAGCCTQSRVCCSYKQGWAESNPKQRQGVCSVANNKQNCASEKVGNFDIKVYGGDISKGAFPGDGCSKLWKTGGDCEVAGFASCPECTQDYHA